MLAHAERSAFDHGGRGLTYRELDAGADRLAARLGMGAGERVVVVAPNVPALAVAMLAVWRKGGVAVPLSARLREYELRGILQNAEPIAVVTVAAHRGQSFVELIGTLARRLPTLRTALVVDELGDVTDELRWDRERADAEPLAPAIGVVLYTSGTTGEPKGVLVQHTRETRAAATLGGILELEPDDRSAQPIPMAHAFGLTCMLTSLAAGACVVLADSSFSPRELLAVLEAGEATLLHGSPALWISLTKAAPGGLRGIRTGLIGGSSVPPELVERLDELGTRVLNVYGMTEIGAASCCRLDDSAEVRYATSGRPLPGYELRVERELSAGAGGELFVRGDSVTPGYLGRPDQTAESFVDGWLRTGDLGFFDETGHLRITGRIKQVVHVAGFSVFPAEVEAFLLTHPEIVHAAVVGVPHETMGEVLQAFVVPRAGSDLTPPAILRFARAKIADYKLPYGVRILPRLPVLASGKPDLIALRRMAAEARMGTGAEGS